MTASEVVIHYLEMRQPEDLRPKPCPSDDVLIMECEHDLWPLNRFFYQLVGADWRWTDKLDWSSAQWQAYVHDPNLRTFVLYQQGTPAGYYELLRHPAENDVQLLYFGLVPDFIGRGLGGYLLSRAVADAWAWDARRVWLHTCTLDHPHALRNYEARGFRLYKQETQSAQTAS